jgi:glycosyltransferase involved in cell wall biosynthesis
MPENKPLVSIGLPVYNGEKYLKQSIDSILDQTFTDFELIISDNASTDSTPEICHKVVTQDARVRYQRNTTNIGGANNANLTFKMARGKYFRWAAHDDICAPELLQKCVGALDLDPGVVIAYPMTWSMDEMGKVFNVSSHIHAVSQKPHERFRKIACADDACEEIYGVMRADILRKTRLLGSYTSSDRVLLTELSLYGQFSEVPEPLFYKRYHPGNVFLDWRARMAWFDPRLMGKIVFPFWMQFMDYLVTITRVGLPVHERIRCYLAVIEWVLCTGGKSMIKDLLVAGYMSLHTAKWRIESHQRGMNWQ